MSVELMVKLWNATEGPEAYEIGRSSGVSVTGRRRGEMGPSGPEVEVIDPITAVLVAGAALAVAKFVTDWIERRRGGLVIDLRVGAHDELRRDPDVPSGYVIVLPADGSSVQINVKDAPKDAMERLLEAILNKTYQTGAALVEAAAKELGAGRVKK